jgi:hypothetical protein
MWNESGRRNGTFTNAIIRRVRPVAEVVCSPSSVDQNHTMPDCTAPEKDRNGQQQHLRF